MGTSQSSTQSSSIDSGSARACGPLTTVRDPAMQAYRYAISERLQKLDGILSDSDETAAACRVAWEAFDDDQRVDDYGNVPQDAVWWITTRLLGPEVMNAPSASAVGMQLAMETEVFLGQCNSMLARYTDREGLVSEEYFMVYMTHILWKLHRYFSSMLGTQDLYVVVCAPHVQRLGFDLGFFTDHAPAIVKVESRTFAKASGIAVGDSLLAVDDETIFWGEMPERSLIAYVRQQLRKRPVRLQFRRGEPRTVSIDPPEAVPTWDRAPSQPSVAATLVNQSFTEAGSADLRERIPPSGRTACIPSAATAATGTSFQHSSQADASSASSDYFRVQDQLDSRTPGRQDTFHGRSPAAVLHASTIAAPRVPPAVPENPVVNEQYWGGPGGQGQPDEDGEAIFVPAPRNAGFETDNYESFVRRHPEMERYITRDIYNDLTAEVGRVERDGRKSVPNSSLPSDSESTAAASTAMSYSENPGHVQFGGETPAALMRLLPGS